MDFDIKKVVDRVTAHYGEPITIDQNDDPALPIPRVFVRYDVMDLAAKIPVESEIDVEAQVEAIQWLIGRCEDQFVKAWLISERELCKKAGGVKS